MTDFEDTNLFEQQEANRRRTRWLVVAFIAFYIVKLTMGLRVPEEQEREGLDISSHGESAYRV